MGWGWTGWRARGHWRRMAGGVALLFGWLTGCPAFAATIRTVTVAENRIVVRFDARIAQADSRVLAGARAVAIDLPGVTLGKSLADRYRLVAGKGGARRLIVPLVRPAVVRDGGFDDGGRTLTLSLAPIGDAGFAAASLAPPISFFPFSFNAVERSRYRVSVAVPATAKALPLPRVEGAADRPLVVIDPGHGGIDPGAISTASGLREKDLTLAIAKTIRDRLVASGRVRVALTRDDDRYLVLRERFGIARRLHADLFISIHCDSTGTDSVSGASVYTLSEVASDKEAARLATRENKADVINGVDLGGAGADVSSILIDLTQRETMNNSAAFAQLLGREAKPYLPMKPVFHRMASLMVLKAPDMPSILLETGYISNPADAAFLDSRAGRRRIADAVEHAVEVHFARRMAAR